MKRILFSIAAVLAVAGLFAPDCSHAGATGALEAETVDANGTRISAPITVKKGKKTVKQGAGSLTATLPTGLYIVTFGDLDGYSIKDPKTGKKNAVIKPGKTTKAKATYTAASTGGTTGGTTTPSFKDNGDKTVTDAANNLMWQQENNLIYYADLKASTYDANWYKASGAYDATSNSGSESVCGSLSLAGHSDWRLPAYAELKTLASASASAFFSNTTSIGHWSSTTSADDASQAWFYNFAYSFTGTAPKTDGGAVRCVRDIK